MKKVILKKISIQNFRSKSFEFEFGERNEIRGKNRSGKSSVKNAFFWLLTGADDLDRTNYNLFDTTIVHTKENSVPTNVTAVLLIDDVEYEVSRTAKMGWTRKRGNDEYERKTSDDYSFAIDGIERSATEFKNWIEDTLAPVDMLKCMINTQHFLYNIDDWKVQRKYLANIAGEITNEDFNGDYTELFAQFSKYTAEQLRERLKTLLMPLKKALGTEGTKGEKVVELEVLQKNLVDVSEIAKAELELQTLKEERDKIQAKISGKKSPIDEASAKRAQALAKVEEKEVEIRKARKLHDSKQQAEVAELESQLSTIEARNEAIKQQNDRDRKAFERKKQFLIDEARNVEILKNRLEELREENKAIKSREFDGYNCAYCGAPLDDDKVEELKAKFEERKQKDRDNNKADGLQAKQRLETAQADLDVLQKEVDKGFTPAELVSEGDLRERIQQRKAAFPPFENSDEYKYLSKELEDLKKSVPEIPVIDTSEFDKELNEVNAKIEAASNKAGLRAQYTKQTKQIVDVQSDMRKMAQERAQLEKIEQQLVAYEQEKADIVGKRVNQFFDKCKVSMFSEKKDGSLAPNCVITMDGRRSATLNKEGTITAGIDVSDAFCRFYGLNMPLFVDDNESLSDDNYVTSERQIITLSVANCELELIKK